MIVLLLAVVVSVLAVYLLVQAFRIKKALLQEQEENCRLRELLQIGSEAASADLTQLKRVRHDLRQYLTLAESAAAPAKTAALRDMVESAPPAVEWESWVISALERHYLERAKSLRIQADLRIAFPRSWKGAIPDLGLVLNNLLENAIEALQREGGGWLRARSIYTDGYFSLVVGNSCAEPLRTLGGRYLSSKSPGRFGIGLETVQEIAKRYGGQAEFTVENGEFRASVFLLKP